jgi:hypothetical protein
MKCAKLTILVLLLAGGAWASAKKVQHSFTGGRDVASPYHTGVATLGSQHDARGTLVSTVIEIANHGGWSLEVNVGANKGDHITLDVKCDHDIQGNCLVGQPALADGTLFSLDVKHSGFEHQRWMVDSPNTGDQFINASYWWIGTDVHYEVRIVAIEAL